MRLSQLFNSRHRVAPEPHGANPNKTTPLIPGASPQHPLSQAPKSTTSQGASKSHRGMLASARKSLASLRKQLPLTCMGSSPTLETVESPPAHTAAVTPGRTQQQHGTQARVDQRWQPPVPNATDHERVQRPQPQPQQTPPTRQSMSVPPKPARAQQLHGPQRPVDPRMQPPIPERMRRDEGQPPQHDKPASPPVPITPAQSSLRSPRPQPGRQPSLRRLDLQLEEITRQCSDIQKQLFMEDREATPQEQHLLKTRAALIAWRNEVRDSQLEALLVALAPMEDIRAPRTTSSGLAMVQMDAMQHNRREVLKARRKSVDRAALARNYARAQRRLESLKQGDAPKEQIRRLQRMMQGYQNMLALEQIVRSTDDQLERLGAPRLMSGIPTTAEQRRQSFEKERDAHQEAIDNGYY
ncbi:type III secretion system effector protein XopR [Xanthomonas campestris pv. raphani]|uniref:type III secretion system effector protein XopR n=1 Tax=Xanthomonas campestris TaxID=339 RepID=UPI000E32AFE3|nr:type III secretion system effector protein XopR [Xanthomonas campestris]MEA9748539.1 type III secretion system effector protein XopR [Xanthomonas campestris pv. raphani]MEA9759333.1 type III secretion system effector protein XopR [Xanthomonas campestris pv. raphani]MEA9785359.1 type III secretion system effector protein XopR [Xanthomonas campestris pv. raphani]MEA9792906.1 type III secretion system effector protein XopR [Xanthomonas campestris pv. raphani]MEA9796865.1 type III secretion sys